MSNPEENQQTCNVCGDEQVFDDEAALVEHIRTKHIPDDRDEIEQQYGRIYSREFADDTSASTDQNLGPSGDGSTDSSVEENEETADAAASNDDVAGEQKRGSFEIDATDDDGGGVASVESSPGRNRAGTDQPTGSDVSGNRHKSGRRSGTDSTRT